MVAAPRPPKTHTEPPAWTAAVPQRGTCTRPSQLQNAAGGGVESRSGMLTPFFGVKAVSPFGSPSHLQRCQDAPSSRLRIEAFHTPQSCLPRAVAATSHIDATVGCCSCTAVAPGVQTRQSIPETAGGTLTGPSIGKMRKET